MNIQSASEVSENIKKTRLADNIAVSLQKDFNSPEQYYWWLKGACEKIILRDELPPLAFGYLI